MTKFVLDTNVISELMRPAPNGNVVGWLEAQASTDLHLTVITLMEMAKGIEMKRKVSPGKADELERVREAIVGDYGDRMLPFDAVAAEATGQLMARFPERDVEDLQIAGIAIVRDMTVVTRNGKHFDRIGLPVLNPFGD